MLCPISMHHEATLHHDVHVCYSALGLLACTKKNLCWLDYSAAALGLFACTKTIVVGWNLKDNIRSLTLLLPEKV